VKKWSREHGLLIVVAVVAVVAIVVSLTADVRSQNVRRWIEIRQPDGELVGRFAAKGGVDNVHGDLSWQDDDGGKHRFILGACSVSFESRDAVEK